MTQLWHQMCPRRTGRSVKNKTLFPQLLDKTTAYKYWHIRWPTQHQSTDSSVKRKKTDLLPGAAPQTMNKKQLILCTHPTDLGGSIFLCGTVCQVPQSTLDILIPTCVHYMYLLSVECISDAENILTFSSVLSCTICRNFQQTQSFVDCFCSWALQRRHVTKSHSCRVERDCEIQRSYDSKQEVAVETAGLPST